MAIWSPLVVGERALGLKDEHHLADYALTLQSTVSGKGQTIILWPATAERKLLIADPKTPDKPARFKKSFTLTDIASVQAVELQLKTGVLGSMSLALQVNKQPRPLLIYDRDTFKMKKFNQFVKDHPAHSAKLDIGGVLVQATEVKKLFQRIPVSWLQEGTNTIELATAPISFKGISWYQASIATVAVRIGRKNEP